MASLLGIIKQIGTETGRWINKSKNNFLFSTTIILAIVLVLSPLLSMVVGSIGGTFIWIGSMFGTKKTWTESYDSVAEWSKKWSAFIFIILYAYQWKV